MLQCIRPSRESQSGSVLTPGERSLIASSISTIESLGIAFGAAVAGLVVHTAGRATEISLATFTATAAWVYRLGSIAPLVFAVLAWRLVRLHISGYREAPVYRISAQSIDTTMY